MAKTCWICQTEIPAGQSSRDHLMPKSRAKFPVRGVTRLADKECNNARGNLLVEEVEAIQAQGLSQASLRDALIDRRRQRWSPNISREACEQ